MAESNLNDDYYKNATTEHGYSLQQSVYTYRNQRLVTTYKPDYRKIGKSFIQIGNDDWHKASQELTYSAFKLWMYLMENINGYHWALSQVAVERTLGMKKGAYDKAKKELFEKGYLVEPEGNDGLDYRPTYALSSPGLDVNWSNKTYKFEEVTFENRPYYAPNSENPEEFKPRDW